MSEPEWDESMVREGCICGHGQYQHPNAGTLGKMLGQRSNCIRCDCPEFRRDRRGDRPNGGAS